MSCHSKIGQKDKLSHQALEQFGGQGACRRWFALLAAQNSVDLCPSMDQGTRHGLRKLDHMVMVTSRDKWNLMTPQLLHPIDPVRFSPSLAVSLLPQVFWCVTARHVSHQLFPTRPSATRRPSGVLQAAF